MHLGSSRLAVVCLGLVTACAPALREPPPVATLGASSATMPAGAAAPADVDRLLAEAEGEFARRPDMQAVTSAYGTYLAAARADGTRIEGLLGAARAAAWMIEHEPGDPRRSVLATEAVQVCQWCLARAPSEIECKYRLALALGQQARERRSTARDGLDRMVALLEEVVREAPRLDKAGGHRVLALVLLRAPGWPAGPGDPDAALDHARKADALFADDADNLLVLGEALAANGAAGEARVAYERATAIAQERAAAGDPDAADILTAAARALRRDSPAPIPSAGAASGRTRDSLAGVRSPRVACAEPGSTWAIREDFDRKRGRLPAPGTGAAVRRQAHRCCRVSGRRRRT